MLEPQTTAWDLIEGAAAGERESLQKFVERYQGLVREWLRARWRRTDKEALIDDALQEALLECIKRGGALTRVDRSRAGGFRPFLQGVVRNVAARYQTRRARDKRRGGELLSPDQVPSPQTTVSQAIDQELARALVREAADAMAARANRLGASARLRVEILRLRFGDDLPIRDIATRLGEDPDRVHHQYAKAREEYRRMLLAVVARRLPGTRAEVEGHCERLMDLLRKQ